MTGKRLPAEPGWSELTQALGNRPPEAEGLEGKRMVDTVDTAACWAAMRKVEGPMDAVGRVDEV